MWFPASGKVGREGRHWDHRSDTVPRSGPGRVRETRGNGGCRVASCVCGVEVKSEGREHRGRGDGWESLYLFRALLGRKFDMLPRRFWGSTREPRSREPGFEPRCLRRSILLLISFERSHNHARTGTGPLLAEVYPAPAPVLLQNRTGRTCSEN